VLLGATAEWFRDLLEGFVTYEYREEGENNDDDDDGGGGGGRHEEKNDDRVADRSIASAPKSRTVVADATTAGTTPLPRRRTIWMHHLLVLPLECNFGGDRFDWSETAAAAGKPHVSSYHLHHRRSPLESREGPSTKTTTIRICHKWHVLLDTAKAAATSPVDLPTLARGRVDFAVASFYKLFGSPTGLGALFVRRQHHRRDTTPSGESRPDEAMMGVVVVTARGDFEEDLGGGVTLERCRPPRHFFGGGSVDVVLPEEDYMVPRNAKKNSSIADKINGAINLYEDEHIDLGVMSHGTEHFRGIVNLVHGFQELDDVGGMGMASSNTHVLLCTMFPPPLTATHSCSSLCRFLTILPVWLPSLYVV
jgi:hypothetical protein